MLSVFISKLLLARQFTLSEKEFKIFNKGFYLQPLKQLAFLQKKLEEKFGEKGFQMLYETGKESFFEMSKELESPPRAAFLNALLSLLQHLGFGKIEIIEIKDEKQEARVKVKDNPYAKEYLKMFGVQKTPVDHLLAGVIAGYFSIYFNKDVDCTEESCIGKGNLICEFLVKSS